MARREDMQSMLADRSLRESLEAMVRKRVPAAEVDDIVQAALAEALESETAPEEAEALRRWLAGVVRHKVADYYRRTRRQGDLDEADEPAETEAHSGRDLLRWAEKELPESKDAKTLEWMVREGEGEKLESIAASEAVPAPRVRQRVSRLRRHLRERWQRELALVAALAAVLGIGFWVWRERTRPRMAHDVLPQTSPRQMAQRLREHALGRCEAGAWQECVAGLDAARAADPQGDATDRVKEARAAAARALAPAPAPSTVPSAIPVPSASPSAAPSAIPIVPTSTVPTALPTTPPKGPDSFGGGSK